MHSFLYLLLIGALLAVMYVIKRLEKGIGSEKEKAMYAYTVRESIMTVPEREVYAVLQKVVGEKYVVVPQVHLSTILDEKVRGQDWRAALAHIQRKSVDYCVCDAATFAPKLAVELDDSTHTHDDRKERDVVVEEIFKNAGLPLVRIPNVRGAVDASYITAEVRKALQ
jgi:very-short-patch-repair endonuclease